VANLGRTYANVDVLSEFLDENRDIFLGGKLRPYNPECFYSLVEADGGDTSINVCYNKNVVDIHNDHTIIVNGTGEKYIVLTVNRSGMLFTQGQTVWEK